MTIREVGGQEGVHTPVRFGSLAARLNLQGFRPLLQRAPLARDNLPCADKHVHQAAGAPQRLVILPVAYR
jgi:hypothetical protein